MYALVIVMSLYFTKQIKEEKEQHFLWVCISLFLLAMGINKQLDIQILLTMVGKHIAWDFELFEFSRVLWKTFALGILISVIIVGILIVYKSKGILHKEKLSLVGVTLLLLFTLIRVGSISHIRIVAYLQYRVIPKIHGLELLGLIIILLSLILKLRILKRAVPIQE